MFCSNKSTSFPHGDGGTASVPQAGGATPSKPAPKGSEAGGRKGLGHPNRVGEASNPEIGKAGRRAPPHRVSGAHRPV